MNQYACKTPCPLRETRLRSKAGPDFYTLLEPDLKERINRFEERYFAALISGKKIPHVWDHTRLPFSGVRPYNSGWQFRSQGIKAARKCMRELNAEFILEIGPYNGWLSQYLARYGNLVVADYFIHECFGLKSKKFYPQQWTSIRTDLRDLSFLKPRFDLIVVNHCLQFFEDPVSYVEELKKLLRAGGILLAIGLAFHRNEKRHQAHVSRFSEYFRKGHNLDVFLFPGKYFLTMSDKIRIAKCGMRFIEYYERGLLRRLFRIAELGDSYGYAFYTAPLS